MERCGGRHQGHTRKNAAGLARKLAKTAPPTFTQVARKTDRSVQIGGKNTVFAPVYGPPFVRDLDGVRRYATMKDFENVVKLHIFRLLCITQVGPFVNQ